MTTAANRVLSVLVFVGVFSLTMLLWTGPGGDSDFESDSPPTSGNNTIIPWVTPEVVPDPGKPKLTIYTSESCPPCRQLEAFIESQPLVAKYYDIEYLSGAGMSTPTSVVTYNGKEVRRFVGFSSDRQYCAELDACWQVKAPAIAAPAAPIPVPDEETEAPEPTSILAGASTLGAAAGRRTGLFGGRFRGR